MFDFLASAKSALPGIALALLVAYLILFARLIVRHPSDAAVLRSDNAGKRGNLLLMPLVLAAVVAPMPYKALAFCIGLVLLAVLARSQHLRLASAGVSRAFLRQHAAVSCVAGAAMLAYGSTMLPSAGS